MIQALQENLIDLQLIKKSAAVLRALNHNYRQLIIKKIVEKGRMTVTELYIALRDEQSIVSQHLRILREAAILKSVRQGKFIFYEINESKIFRIKDGIAAIIS